MGRSLDIDWHHTRQQLAQLYHDATELKYRTCLQALMLLRQGQGLTEVALTVGVSYRTLQRWVTWYRTGSLAEVRAHCRRRRRGLARRLSPAQEAALRAQARSGQVRSVWDGVHWAAAQGVAYTYWGMRWVFDRLELRKKVPRPSNPKASPAVQAAWKKGGSRTPLSMLGLRRGRAWCGAMKCAWACSGRCAKSGPRVG